MLVAVLFVQRLIRHVLPPPPRTLRTPPSAHRLPCQLPAPPPLPRSYCECFASGRYCDGFNRINCCNNREHEATRQSAVEAILERNPNAFRPKIAGGVRAVRCLCAPPVMRYLPPHCAAALLEAGARGGQRQDGRPACSSMV